MNRWEYLMVEMAGDGRSPERLVSCQATHDPRQDAAMRMVLTLGDRDMVAVLEAVGDDGWELVTITERAISHLPGSQGSLVYFKRPRLA